MQQEKYEQELDDAIIQTIRNRVKKRPQLIGRIISAITGGCEDAVIEANERAADMETLASVAYGLAEQKGRATAKTKDWFEKLAMSKIAKYYPKLFVPWEQVLPDKKS